VIQCYRHEGGTLRAPREEVAVTDPAMAPRGILASSDSDTVTLLRKDDSEDSGLAVYGTVPQARFGNEYRIVGEEEVASVRYRTIRPVGGRDILLLVRPQDVTENRVVEDRGALFDHRPTVTDVQQGNLGNCYLIGAITAIVQARPQFILGMIRDNGDATDGSPGTATVRFYNRVVDDSSGTEEVTFTPRYVRVSKSVIQQAVWRDGAVVFEDRYARGALWVKLMEKAYVAAGFNTRVYSRSDPEAPDAAPGYQTGARGEVKVTMEHLTGKVSSRLMGVWEPRYGSRHGLAAANMYSMSDPTARAVGTHGYTQHDLDFFDVLRAKVKRGRIAITAGSLDGPPTDGIGSSHNYAITGIEPWRGKIKRAGQARVKLNDPHQHEETWLDFKDFQRSFGHMVFSGRL